MSTLIVNPSSYYPGKNTYSSASNTGNVYADITSTAYAQFNLTPGAQAVTSIGLAFNLEEIPNDAIINSVSCSVKATINTTTSSYVSQRTVQLYSGDIAKGSTSNLGEFATIIELDTGNWTRAELDNLNLYVFAKRGTSKITSTYYIRFYGADLTIEYTSGGVTQTLKIKSNGKWTDVSKVYKKENGSWIEQTELSQVFDTNINYVKEN